MQVLSKSAFLVALLSVSASWASDPIVFYIGVQDSHSTPLAGIKVTITPSEPSQPVLRGITDAGGEVTLRWDATEQVDYDGTVTAIDPSGKYDRPTSLTVYGTNQGCLSSRPSQQFSIQMDFAVPKPPAGSLAIPITSDYTTALRLFLANGDTLNPGVVNTVGLAITRSLSNSTGPLPQWPNYAFTVTVSEAKVLLAAVIQGVPPAPTQAKQLIKAIDKIPGFAP